MSNPNATPVSGSDEHHQGISDPQEMNATPVSSKLGIGDLDHHEEELKELHLQTSDLQSQLAEHIDYTVPDVELNWDESALEKVKKVRTLVEVLSCYLSHIRVAKLMTKFLYDDKTFGKPTGRQSDKGLCVLVVDQLVRKLWVTKKGLAESLKMKEKLVSEVLGFLKEKDFVKNFPEEAEEQSKGKNKRKRDNTIYYSLQYDKIPTVARLLSLKVHQKLSKDKLQDTNFYLCEKCNKHYSSLDAPYLVSCDTDGFECEVCRGELKNLAKEFEETENNKIQKAKDVFAPIQKVLDEIENLPKPNFPKQPVLKDDNPDVDEFREIEDSDFDWGEEEPEPISDDNPGAQGSGD